MKCLSKIAEREFVSQKTLTMALDHIRNNIDDDVRIITGMIRLLKTTVTHHNWQVCQREKNIVTNLDRTFSSTVRL